MQQTKKLVVFSGLPGTGKSTLSKRYAQECDAVWLSVDPIEGAMKLSGVEDNYQLGVAAYETIKVLASQHLALNKSVVVDAVNPIQETRKMWHLLAKQHDITATFVECVLADQALHKQRIEARVRNIPGLHETTWQDVQSRKSEYQPWHDERVIIDTGTPFEESYKQLLTRLAILNA